MKDGFTANTETTADLSGYAYGLPAGSIRALLAVMIFGSIWAWLARTPDVQVPSFLRDLMFIIMGHYFASRSKHVTDSAEPAPLFLPRGTIRWILILGFLGTAILLYSRQQLGLNAAGVTLLAAFGFLLGVLRAKIFTKRRRIFEDIRATIALVSGCVLIALVFGLFNLPDLSGVHPVLSLVHCEEILAGAVGFYFGSKS